MHSSSTVQFVPVHQEKIFWVKNYISNQDEDIKSLRNMVVIYEAEYDHYLMLLMTLQEWWSEIAEDDFFYLIVSDLYFLMLW